MTVYTVLPLLAAKFFLAPSRLDGGRPRENFTAATIPVRWLHSKPYAHHLTTSQARPPRFLQGPGCVNLNGGAVPAT